MRTEILSPSTGQRQLKAVHADATVAGVPVKLASGIVAIPVVDGLAATENTYDHNVECVEVDKATGQAWLGGAKIYWDDTAKDFTTTVGSNTLAGRAVQPAATGDVRGQIQLTPAA